MDLSNYRKEIDEIDAEITKLFEKRMDVAIKVAEYKIKNNLPILNSTREAEVIEKNVNRLNNTEYKPLIRKYFTNLMELSRSLQKRKFNEINSQSVASNEKNNTLGNERVEFFGLLGEKLSHSLSPEIHETILDNINKNGAYKLFEIEKDKLGEFVASVKLLKIKGFNVTIPYKQEIMKYLDFVSEEAKRIGAVNSVVLKDGKLYGYNTDYFGFGATFEKNKISFKDKVAVILGTGGACKAALTYILDNEIKELYLVSRNPKTTQFNIDDNRVKFISYDELSNIKGDIIINSTPVGMYPNVDECPISEEIIDNYDVVMDIIYNPLETKFLKFSGNKEKIALDGLYMLVAQAVKAQEIFQDININDEIIDNIYQSLQHNFK